jgi:hypothetical protein
VSNQTTNFGFLVRQRGLAGDLDDHGFGGVEEVDASHVAAIAADSLLRDGSRQAGFAHQRQQASLEHRLATAVDQQLVEKPHAATTAAAQLAEALDEHERGGQAHSDRTVDGGSETIRRRPYGGEIEDRAGGRGTAKTTDREHVDGTNLGCRVDDATGRRLSATRPRRGELRRTGRRPIEAEMSAGTEGSSRRAGRARWLPKQGVSGSRNANRDTDVAQRPDLAALRGKGPKCRRYGPFR